MRYKEKSQENHEDSSNCYVEEPSPVTVNVQISIRCKHINLSLKCYLNILLSAAEILLIATHMCCVSTWSLSCDSYSFLLGYALTFIK